MASPSAPPPLRDDGLPTLATGEPVLARWFVVAMGVLVAVAIVVTAWAFLSIRPGDPIPAAQRKPAGDGEVTVRRGEAQLNPVDEFEMGPECAARVQITGDSGARAAGRRALDATCQLLRGDAFPEARQGLREWSLTDGELRFATFELAGVESSARLEDGRLVVELNAAFQFQDAILAAPTILHQLVLVAEPTWPGERLPAVRAVAAAEVEHAACERLGRAILPRGCRDVEELLAEADPLGALVEAGYRADAEPEDR